MPDFMEPVEPPYPPQWNEASLLEYCAAMDAFLKDRDKWLRFHNRRLKNEGKLPRGAVFGGFRDGNKTSVI